MRTVTHVGKGRVGMVPCILGLCLALALATALPAPVLAVPQLPERFQGGVTINASPAPAGVQVSATISGVTEVFTATTDANGNYSLLYVKRDDPNTPQKEGGVDGDAVQFLVAGTPAASSTFASGASVTLNLSVSSSTGGTGGGGGGGGGGTPGVTAPAPGTNSLSGLTDASGTFKQMATARSSDSLCSLTIPAGTTARQADGAPLSQITMVKSTSPATPPPSVSVVGLVYAFGPAGAAFSTPVTLTFTYNPSLIPQGLSQTSLFMAQHDANVGSWARLPSSVDPGTHTVTTQISHFSDFTALISTRPATFTVSNLVISPAEVNAGETVRISMVVANNGDFGGSHTVNLTINSAVVDSKPATVAGGTTQPVIFTATRNTAGTYTIGVDGLSGAFTVKAVPTPTVTPAPASTLSFAPTVTPAAIPVPGVALTPAPPATPPASRSPLNAVNWSLIGGITIGSLFVSVIVWRLVTLWMKWKL